MQDTPGFSADAPPAPPASAGAAGHDPYDLRSGRAAVAGSAGAAGSKSEDLDVMSLLLALWHGKWLILGIVLIVGALGAHFAYNVAVPKFRSVARLALQDRGPQVVNLESVVSGVSTERAAINTEIEVIRSRELVSQVVDDLNLMDDPEFNITLREPSRFSLEALNARIKSLTGGSAGENVPDPDLQRRLTIGQARSAITVSAVRDSYIYEIRVTTEHPRKSAEIANRLANVYIDDQVRIKFAATEYAVRFLTQRVSELEDELAEKESRIKDVRTSAEVLSPEALDLLNLRAGETRDRVRAAEREVAAAEAKQAQLQALREARSIAATAEMTDDAILDRLAQQQATGNRNAEAAFWARVNAMIEGAGNDRTRAEARRVALASSLEQITADIAEKSESLIVVGQLQREADATRILFETFLTRLKETSIQVGLQRPDSRILSTAVRGSMVEPRRLRITAVAIILGAMAAIGLILVRQLMYSGFRTTEELENRTGRTVLGMVPRFPVKQRGALVDYLSSHAISAGVEAVRNLRTSVLMSNLDKPSKVIMLTSSLPGEGKTTLSISLSHNLAGLGKRVLLIEGDIRRRTFTSYFETPIKQGLISVLFGDVPVRDVIHHDTSTGIDVLMGEKSSVNAADVLSSDRFAAFIAQMRQHYDYVIVDTPPVLIVPDARIIGRLVDTVLYVVNWNATTRDQVRAGLREMDTAGLHINGLVLTQVDPKGITRYGYGYSGSYGAYSAYGKGYYDKA